MASKWRLCSSEVWKDLKLRCIAVCLRFSRSDLICMYGYLHVNLNHLGMEASFDVLLTKSKIPVQEFSEGIFGAE